MTTTELNESNTNAAQARVNDWANRYGISANFAFVPFSLSRNSGEKFPSLNWKVTLYKDQREILRFDYMQGSGHAPSYKQNARYQIEADKVAFECEHGKVAREICGTMRGTMKIKPPSLSDVLYSISSDSDAIDFATFDDWASEFGYEKDSRKAEAIYKTCLEYGLKLRSAIGNKGLDELRKAVSDM